MNRIIIVQWILFLSLSPITTYQDRTFECINNKCQRTNKPILNIDPIQLKLKRHHTTLAACRLVCGVSGGLWPIPTGSIIIGKNYIPTNTNGILFKFENIDETTETFLLEIKEIFMNNLRLMCGPICSTSDNNSLLTINIQIDSTIHNLNWTTNESYKLQISNKGNTVDIKVAGVTVYGVRHGLETLSQLFAPIIINSNNVKGLVIVDEAVIEDKPVFVHRGLLIDTARNYLPISAILRTIDGLAATKMNVLHWHATDTQSFPLQINRRPLMSQYGSYSSQLIYTLEDISHIVNYAKYRGVRIIMELDSPSHAGSGWDWGVSSGLGNLAVCINKEPWRDFCIQPPCGQLNPINPNTFNVMRDIYADILSALDNNSSLIHFGGDEVFIGCWNSTDEIVSEMKRRKMGQSTDDFLQLWSEFHARQMEILDGLYVTKQEGLLLWSSALTSPDVIEKYVDKSRFVIQTWVESNSNITHELLKRGYKLIISTKDAWYLDHGFWGRTKYHTWRDAYNNRIPRSDGVLGGEVCMWGEYVNAGGLDARVWPRAAAAGERLWSDYYNLTTGDVESRLQAHRERLQSRKINADAISPTWCAHHTQKCL